MRASDLIAVTMARKLADAGLDVSASLWRGEWTVVAVRGERQSGFGFRCTAADLIIDPEGYAELHVRKLIDSLEDA
jgi:hypothetical protein